jgi:formate dehydrogenase maturation protein FdhE
MAPDRDEDWTPFLDKKEKERVRKQAPDLRAQGRAALSASQVTGDEHWDRFLQVVQARIEECAAERDGAAEALKNSDDFSPETLVKQKLAARLYGKEVDALKWVISLPQIIMEKGERARELLGKLDETTD